MSALVSCFRLNRDTQEFVALIADGVRVQNAPRESMNKKSLHTLKISIDDFFLDSGD